MVPAGVVNHGARCPYPALLCFKASPLREHGGNGVRSDKAAKPGSLCVFYALPGNKFTPNPPNSPFSSSASHIAKDVRKQPQPAPLPTPELPCMKYCARSERNASLLLWPCSYERGMLPLCKNAGPKPSHCLRMMDTPLSLYLNKQEGNSTIAASMLIAVANLKECEGAGGSVVAMPFPGCMCQEALPSLQHIVLAKLPEYVGCHHP